VTFEKLRCHMRFLLYDLKAAALKLGMVTLLSRTKAFYRIQGHNFLGSQKNLINSFVGCQQNILRTLGLQ
jgi:hypothetical protein